MTYKTNWKDFLKYDENGKRVMDFPTYVVDTAPGEKRYMYHGEYMAMVAAEQAVKNAARAAREAELAASRPNSTNNLVTPSSPASNPTDPAARRLGSPPDLERHSRRCLICSHPDRDAIEGEFIRWRSPHKIARDYGLSDRATIYRHAHANDLFAERRRHVARVLESFLETIDDNPPADFDPVTRAVRVYAHLNAHGDWFEPLRKVHITTSHIHTSHPNPAPDSELELDDDDRDSMNAIETSRVEARDFSHGSAGLQAPRIETVAERRTSVEVPPRSDRNDSSASARRQPHTSEVPVGTKERVGQAFRPDSRSDEARKCWEEERPEPPTFSLAERDCPSGASQENSQATAFRSAEGNTSTKVAASGRDKTAPHESQISNRNNPKIEISPNQQETNDISKVNRNKNSERVSGFVCSNPEVKSSPQVR